MHPSDVVRKYMRPGDVLSERYEVETFIGSGAYGSIFTAIDTITMERVAVKALPPPNTGVNQTALGRFQREMKVVSSIRHPNVITMYDYGETKDRLVYMVLEYVDGQTLYDLVADRRFGRDDALAVTRQIASGLKAAHDLGVVHRDLKPQNIMLMPERGGGYEVKVLDFGMAKLLSRINDESIIQLTREGVAVGTPRYIAPEQARGQTVGPYSDLYALGLLMYEMFTGQRAVKADSVETAIMAHVSRKPLELEELERVPASVRPLLMKLIEKNPRKRYQTAADVIADIEELETRSRHEVVAKRKAERTPAAPPRNDASERLRSIHSADNLELDYDRFEAHAPKKKARRRSFRAPRGSSAPFVRLPRTTHEWMETGFAVLLAPLAFVFLSAHMWESGYVVRLFVGAFPTLFAALVSLMGNTVDWRWSFVRLWLLANIVGFMGSHILMTNLAVGLASSPGWFLSPLGVLPGIVPLHDAIRALCRAHVEFVLMPMSPDVVRAVAPLL